MVKAPVPQETQTRKAYQGFSSMKQPIGPLQLIIHVIQPRHAGGRTGTRQTKEITILDDTSYFSCPSVSSSMAVLYHVNYQLQTVKSLFLDSSAKPFATGRGA